jgi:hypothetical protein
MHEITSNTHFIPVEGDKNTGACYLRRGWYNSRGATEHLKNESVYKRISADEAKHDDGS